MREMFKKFRRELAIRRIHLTFIRFEKQMIVSSETMKYFYKGKVNEYEKSIGDALEDFRALASFQTLYCFMLVLNCRVY